MEIDCVTLITEATGLTAREAARIIREIGQDAARQGIENNPSAIMKMASEHKANRIAEAANAKRRAQISAVRLGEGEGKVRGYKSTFQGLKHLWVTAPTREKWYHLRNSKEQVSGSMLSVESRQKALEGEVREGLFRDLETGHKGIVKLASQKESGLKIAKELFNTTGKSITGDADAFHIAQVFDKWKEITRNWANQEGANIARIPSHVFAQVHDQYKIAKVGFEAWRDSILPKLDIVKTFGGNNADEILKTIYGKIEKDAYNVFTGNTAPSLAGKMSRERFLHFKGAEELLAYNKEFGTGSNNIMEIYLNGILRRSKEVGMMQVTGPDPDSFHANLMKIAARTDTAPASERMTRSQAEFVGQLYGNLAGHDRVASNPNIAKFMQNLRSYLGMVNLGSATINSFADIGTAGVISSYNGKNILTQYHDILSPHLKDPKVAQFFSTFSDGMMTSISGRFSLEDGMMGNASKLANNYFKWNLLTPWTDHWKEAEAWSLSRHLGDEAGKGFDKLDIAVKNSLDRYGIDAAGWDTIRGATDKVEGHSVVTPDMIKDVELSRKLRMFFMTEVDHAIPTPGAYERTVILRGTKPGTFWGETARSFGQFKMFTLAMTNKVLPRVGEMGIPGAIHMAAVSMIFGYTSLAANNALHGQLPPDPLDPRTWVSALAKSGGAGILADLLLSDYGSYGRGILEIAAGPTGGILADATKLFADAIRFKGKETGADLVKLTMRNIPFQNLFYTQQAINYLFTYQIQEFMHPGHLRQTEQNNPDKNWLSRPDKQYIPGMKPSDIVARGGGWR